MDTVTSYSSVIRHLLDEYAMLYADGEGSGVDTSIICDDEHGEYLLIRVGWQRETRIRRTILYLRLRHGKILVEEDWTEDGIATALLTEGIPHESIVLAFNPPEFRHLTEFATA